MVGGKNLRFLNRLLAFIPELLILISLEDI